MVRAGADFFEQGAGAVERRRARLWTGGGWRTIEESVSPEETVRILYEGDASHPCESRECHLQAWSGNPEHPEYQRDLEDLCLGHVLLDRLHAGPVAGPSPVRRQGRACLVPNPEGNRVVAVSLDPFSATPEPDADRNACGIPGMPGTPGTLTPDALLLHMESFLTLPGTCPRLWESTGCFHRAAMLDVRTGSFVRLAEDIGRHNCLDRLAGWACRNGLFPGDFVLFLSARITGSLYAKARRAGFCFLVSRAALTTAPLEDSTQGGVTLVGFCRPSEARFTVFCDPEGRVVSC